MHATGLAAQLAPRQPKKLMPVSRKGMSERRSGQCFASCPDDGFRPADYAARIFLRNASISARSVHVAGGGFRRNDQ
jgi:hypothetical protein